jgi:diaminopimelate decarboxylase/aspartate kinase
MKANNNPEIIKEIISHGFGLECVSGGEVDYVRKNFGESINMLFTPNFCHASEYVKAFLYGAMVVIDSYQTLELYSEVFRGQSIGIRLDLDAGDGHDKKVVTEGDNIKFGLPLYEIEKFMEVASSMDVKVVFLHSHKGSGILNHKAWADTLSKMKKLLVHFPNVKHIDLGGGLGITTHGKSLDLGEMHKALKEEAKDIGDIKISIEPGRYLVAEAGVIVTTANQVKTKGKFNYLGVDCGMNALIRPMLYGSHHPIYNITRHGEDTTTSYQVVGPICESGDIIGTDIKLPLTDTGDTMLIENVGAYGRVMASDYNMRGYLPEVILPVST